MSRRTEIKDLPLWDELESRGAPMAFDLEITARCNNDCRHCYINLPANDSTALSAELSCDEILAIAREAADMGALWCLLTGGEPLLRPDFGQIYLGLKRMGLLVSVFTNACLVTPAHVELFRHYPPRDVEVSVYGATQATYEGVTRRRGSFESFNRGLDLLLDAGIRVRLKAMAMHSTIGEMDEISRFCRERTADYYRFDPLLHLRFDGDPVRNAEIRKERLSPEEVVSLEGADQERFNALRRGAGSGRPVDLESSGTVSDNLFQCGAGTSSFTVGYDGTFRLCSSLWHPDTVYDLRNGSLHDAWTTWVPRVRRMKGQNPGFLEKCRVCSLANLCMWCPAHAALETGAMDEWVEYFCSVAHARAAALADGLED